MRTSTELTPDDSVARIERVGRYLRLVVKTFCCLIFFGSGFFVALACWSSDSNWTKLQSALLAATFFVCAYELRPRLKGADGNHRVNFPLGNPNATPMGALASALFYASCTVMIMRISVEESSWLWFSATFLMAGISLGYLCLLVYLLRKQ